MKPYPYHAFEIVSPLSHAAAVQAIEAHVDPYRFFRFRLPGTGKDDRFEGSVNGSSFQFQRIIGYRNSFLPQVSGDIERSGTGSRIVVRMHLHAFTYIFLAIWCAFMATTFATAWTDPSSLLWPLAMTAFFYLMTMGGFWFEAPKQEQALRDIFRASN